jgi:three-Cys-motif partner protein
MNEKLVNTPRIINKWFCHKLECFGDFLKYYSTDKPRYYLELFAGCGTYTCKGTDCLIDGSELRTLKNGFSEYIFIVNDLQDSRNLKTITEQIGAKSFIITGNCINDKILRQAFNLIPRSQTSFAFINPPGYNRLRWSTIKKLAAHGKDWYGHKMDLLIVFPLEMALLRNITRPDCEASINRLYGNRDWQQVRKKIQDGSIGQNEARKKLISLYNSGLKGLDYRYVGDIKPARFYSPPNYHLFWASDTHNRILKLTDTWNKPRYLSCELFSNTGNKKE